MEKKLNVAIIGGGIGAIAIALRLKKTGYNVEIFEKNNSIGGKIAEIKKHGYRFDTGPSLFTLPELVDELFDLFNDFDNLDYSKLDLVCRYFWEDKTIIDSFSDAQKFANELFEKVKEPKKNTLNFLKYVSDLYDISADVFIFSSLHKLETWTNPQLRKNAHKAKNLNPLKSMHKQLQKNFSKNKTIQLFSRYATYNGSNPYKAPSTLNVIAHLEHNIGAFFPDKGMKDIINKLEKLINKQNLKINLNSFVEKIIIEKKKTKGIVVNGQKKYFDFVISDIDVNYLHKNLLGEIKTPRKIKNIKFSTSALIFYWGINKEFKELKLHNILFSDNYKLEFNHLFEKKTIYADPTVYIFISSKKVKKDAPKGKENWFVMINTPVDKGQISDTEIEKAKKNIISKINRILNTNIEKHIEFEEKNTPKSIEKYTGSTGGALYGANSNSIMAAFNRHPNFSKKIKNLYFVGGSVHPGGGIPLCLSSAKITEKIIKKDRNS